MKKVTIVLLALALIATGAYADKKNHKKMSKETKECLYKAKKAHHEAGKECRKNNKGKKEEMKACYKATNDTAKTAREACNAAQATPAAATTP